MRYISSRHTHQLNKHQAVIYRLALMENVLIYIFFSSARAECLDQPVMWSSFSRSGWVHGGDKHGNTEIAKPRFLYRWRKQIFSRQELLVEKSLQFDRLNVEPSTRQSIFISARHHSSSPLVQSDICGPLGSLGSRAPVEIKARLHLWLLKTRLVATATVSRIGWKRDIAKRKETARRRRRRSFGAEVVGGASRDQVGRPRRRFAPRLARMKQRQSKNKPEKRLKCFYCLQRKARIQYFGASNAVEEAQEHLQR